MNSELKILKTIWESDQKSYIKLIANQTGFDTDYTRYLCNFLLKKRQIKPIKGKRDWYTVTAKGKKELESRGLIKPKVVKREKDTEKVVYHFPKRISIRDDLLPSYQETGRDRKIKQPISKPKRSRPEGSSSTRPVITPVKRAARLESGRIDTRRARLDSQSKRASKGILIKAEEKKFNLGQSITKAALFLKRSIQKGG